MTDLDWFLAYVEFKARMHRMGLNHQTTYMEFRTYVGAPL